MNSQELLQSWLDSHDWEDPLQVNEETGLVRISTSVEVSGSGLSWLFISKLLTAPAGSMFIITRRCRLTKSGVAEWSALRTPRPQKFNRLGCRGRVGLTTGRQ